MSDSLSGLLVDKNSELPIKKLHQYNPKEVAEELTLMDADLLRKIYPQELENGSWMKKDKKHQLSPNVMAMVQMFNQLALLVPTNVLDEKTPQLRARVVSNYIQMARKCHTCHNYNSLKAILAGLQCTPIFRLNKTWKEVSSRKKKMFKQLTTLMSEEENWSTYRKELEPKMMSSSPFVPFLGVFLTDVALSQEASSLAKRTKSKVSAITNLDTGAEKSSKRSSNTLYETYTILEPITIRNRLEKLRSVSVDDGSGDDPPRSLSTPSDSDRDETDTDSVYSRNKSFDISPSPSKTSSLSSLSSTKHKLFSTKLLPSMPPLSSSPIPSDSVLEWDVEEWLRKMGLERYSESFLDNGYETVELCANLSGKDLDAIGITNKQHRGALVIHARMLLESDSCPLNDTFKQTATTSSNVNVRVLDSDEKELVKVSSVTRKSKGGLCSRKYSGGSLECLIDAVKPGGGSFSENYERISVLIKSSSLHSIDSQDLTSRSDLALYAHSNSELAYEVSHDLAHKRSMSDTAGSFDAGVKEIMLPPQLPLHSTSFNSIETDSRVKHVPSPISSKIRQWLHLDQRMSLPIMSQNKSIGNRSPDHSVLRLLRRESGTVPKLRALQMEKSCYPIDLLTTYQFLSLGCCVGLEANTQLRQLVTDSQHNTETQNYKLSYICETE